MANRRKCLSLPLVLPMRRASMMKRRMKGFHFFKQPSFLIRILIIIKRIFPQHSIFNLPIKVVANFLKNKTKITFKVSSSSLLYCLWVICSRKLLSLTNFSSLKGLLTMLRQVCYLKLRRKGRKEREEYHMIRGQTVMHFRFLLKQRII